MAANPNIDDDTRARARKFVESNTTAAAKPRVVGKKELADSGLSLRDFLNKERGLTRRKDKSDPTAGEAKDRAAQEAADSIDPGNDGGKAEVDRQNAEIAKMGMTPAQYLRSGKAEIDRQDARARKEKDMGAYRPRRASGTNTTPENKDVSDMTFKRGGKVKAYAAGGSVSASRRGDGIATKGKTRGRMC